MKARQLDIYLCERASTLKDMLEKMNYNGRGMLFVVDQSRKLVGVLTDGDIRRWFIKHGSLPDSIDQVMGRNPKYLKQKERDIAIGYMQRMRIRAIPIVDDSLIITDIIFNNRVYEDQSVYHKNCILNNIPIIIMAGGKGTRLWPYTKILPKPLIPIDDVPIIERIMDRLLQFGADSFFVSVNYKKEMIKAYFAEQQIPYSITYIEEDLPLGTAGSLSLLDQKFKEPILTTNCDILLDIDYGDLISFHRKQKHDMTIVSACKRITIPYGVIHSNEKKLLGTIEEKPQLSFEINTGMYLINPDLLDLIPKGLPYHMTDFIDELIGRNKKIGVYPIDEDAFLDMGEFAEMNRMEDRISER